MIYPLVSGAGAVGLFAIAARHRLVHTIFGMPILTLLFRNLLLRRCRIELFKAARVDGAGFWRIFFRVMLPMSLPIVVVAVILQVTGIWNDFLFGLVFAGRDEPADDGAAQQHRSTRPPASGCTTSTWRPPC